MILYLRNVNSLSLNIMLKFYYSFLFLVGFSVLTETSSFAHCGAHQTVVDPADAASTNPAPVNATPASQQRRVQPHVTPTTVNDRLAVTITPNGITGAGTTSPSLASPPFSPLNAIADGDEPAVLVFDWDDTLFASNYFNLINSVNIINPNNPNKTVKVNQIEIALMHGRIKEAYDIKVKEKEKFEALDSKIVTLLKTALEHGKVIIVTNGYKAWIEYTIVKFLPNVQKLIETGQIEISYARQTFGSHVTALGYKPGTSEASREYKFRAFIDTLDKVFGQDSKNQYHLIGFGDASTDRDALLKFAQYKSDPEIKIYTKTIKFKESKRDPADPTQLIHPTPADIGDQIEAITLTLKAGLFMKGEDFALMFNDEAALVPLETN